MKKRITTFNFLSKRRLSLFVIISISAGVIIFGG